MKCEQAWVKETLDKIIDKMSKVVHRTETDFFPYMTKDGRYIPFENDENFYWWTNGFYPGILWLLYSYSKDEKFMKLAEHYEDMLDIPLYDCINLHHDVGFMWLPSSVAHYNIDGNDKSKKRALMAAHILAGRYNAASKRIRALNEPDGTPGQSIIDSMMNLPLLYWASDLINDDRFKHIAVCHANTTMANFVRPDGSVNHVMIFDDETGEVIENKGGQGYGVNSSWTRGQAWGIYGFALSYRFTEKQEYLDTAKRVAHYFIANAAMDDYKIPADFRAPKEPKVYDSSAAAAAACGLLEIAQHVGEFEKDMYINAAIKIVKTLTDYACDFTDDEDALLNKCTGYYFDKNPHHAFVFGDYYYIEALYRLYGGKPLF